MFAYSLLIVILLVVGIGRSENSTSIAKCCDEGSALNENLVCEKLREKNTGNETDAASHAANDTRIIRTVCFKDGQDIRLADSQGAVINNDTCFDVLANGTKVELICNSYPSVVNETIQQCDGLFTQLKFWGATMVIFATMIYNVPFIIVFIIYCAFSELRTRAYDKGLICYNLCYIVINFLLIALGFYNLCHKPLSVLAYRLFGLGLMFFVQGAVCWVLILCFDMTLVITRFRWAPKSGVDRGREEKKKFLIYSAWAWGFSSILTLVATIVEFSPIFPEDSPIRPNFHNFDYANVAVIIYVSTGPAIVCLCTTSLFIYTTVKTIAVQKSTAIINENRKTNVKKRYVLFLKLYLVMDTPWLTSALAAIFDELWVLKFVKMVQPMLMLVLIIPRKRILRAINCSRKKETREREAERLKKDPLQKANPQAGEKINLPAKYR